MPRARPHAGSARLARCLAAALTAVPVLLAPTAAAAEPSWLPPLKVEASPSAAALDFPKIMARPEGCATVAFSRNEGVFASTRPPGGSFPALQALGGIAPAKYPAAASGGGVAALAWKQSGNVVRVATASGCDPLGSPAEISVAAGFAEEVTAAVTGDGTAVVAIAAGSSGSRRIYLSERAPGAAPSVPVPLDPPVGTEAFRPVLAANHAGGAAAVFDVISGGNQVYASRRSGAGSWSAPVKLNAAAAVAGSARAALAPDGTLYAAWVDATGDEVILATMGPTGTVTRTPLVTAGSGSSVREPAIAVDAAGRLAIIWAEGSASSTARIYGKYAEPGDSLSALKSVSAASGEFRGNPYLAIDHQGRTIAVWSAVASVGSIQQTFAAVRPAGGTGFVGGGAISNPDQYTGPSGISTDEDGDTTVALYMTESPREAQVAAFDAAGPLLRGLALPASGVAGTPLAFSVSPLDAWSATVPGSWQFGDGAAVAGDAVSHTYAVAGSFGIGLSVSDSLGNLSTAAGTTAIAPAPSGGSAVGTGPGPAAGVVVPPQLSRLALSRRGFRVGAWPAGGTWISFQLSAVAQLRFQVKPLERGARASRLTRRGEFSRSGKPGRNRVFFSGRIRRASLAPGRYRLRLIAIDAAGQRSRALAASFTVR